MRALAEPDFDPQFAYETCVASVTNQPLQVRLQSITNSITSAAGDYLARGRNKQLYTIPENNYRNDEIVVGQVTKQELRDLYDIQMVSKAIPRRTIYDKLRSIAPLGKCPYCGFGHVSTLDHYLPKSKYPQLSVTPLNLIPACTDCNKGKNAGAATNAEEQSLHPYFDHEHFVNEQWLFAELIQSSPVAARFYVSSPDHWDAISKNRVYAHFRDFKLGYRYAVESGTEIANKKDYLSHNWQKMGAQGVKEYLLDIAESYHRLHRNSWQTAFFQTLAGSDWYCSGGFLN
jgi:5-methylcytosine-specific restriction endonuclease McrA